MANMMKALADWVRTAPKPTTAQVELAIAMAKHKAAIDRLVYQRGVLVSMLAQPNDPESKACMTVMMQKVDAAIAESERAQEALQ